MAGRAFGRQHYVVTDLQMTSDANLAGEMYPDQSLYPANSVPQVVKRINNTFTRADQIQWSEGKNEVDYFDREESRSP